MKNGVIRPKPPLMPYALSLVTFEQHTLDFIDGRFVDFFGFVGIVVGEASG